MREYDTLDSEHVHEFDLVRTRFVCRKCGYILRPPKEAKP